MKKTFLFTAVILFNMSISAQSFSKKEIIGVWEVETIELNLPFKSEVQKERINSIKEGLNKAQFFFSEDEQFTIVLHPEIPKTFDDEMFVDLYTWKLHNDSNFIKIGNNVMGIQLVQKEGVVYFDFQPGLLLKMNKINEMAIIKPPQLDENGNYVRGHRN